ncbi:hypothetical protein BS50DRAFT_379361 [Corynespora cassiicola Philippines]|uniref:Uncharacterized protein n=1 Tax=Corynespora cassiicola Philippines TaxID=1448308 RepID=A0A2T2NNH1_CORCC|nr:hypothetical protein BS50DRAFT_379361 [Corynespora cassiicola Philippines]
MYFTHSAPPCQTSQTYINVAAYLPACLPPFSPSYARILSYRAMSCHATPRNGLAWPSLALPSLPSVHTAYATQDGGKAGKERGSPDAASPYAQALPPSLGPNPAHYLSAHYRIKVFQSESHHTWLLRFDGLNAEKYIEETHLSFKEKKKRLGYNAI